MANYKTNREQVLDFEANSTLQEVALFKAIHHADLLDVLGYTEGDSQCAEYLKYVESFVGWLKRKGWQPDFDDVVSALQILFDGMGVPGENPEEDQYVKLAGQLCVIIYDHDEVMA